MATLRQRGLLPAVVLTNWRCGVTWTPEPGVMAPQSATLHVRASSSADCLAKVKLRMAMHEGIAPVTYGTPALGWIDR